MQRSFGSGGGFTYGVTDTGDDSDGPLTAGPVVIDVTVNNLVDLDDDNLFETLLLIMANDVFSAINEQGDI